MQVEAHGLPDVEGHGVAEPEGHGVAEPGAHGLPDVEVRGLPDAGKALLEIHLVAHKFEDAVDHVWPDSVYALACADDVNHDLAITLAANDALGEWRKNITEVLKYSPVQWCSHNLHVDKLKNIVSILWHELVAAFNNCPGETAEAVYFSRTVTDASAAMGLNVAVAPRYCWESGKVTTKIKYGVTKRTAEGRYRKPTKAQQERVVASRAEAASRGEAPQVSVANLKID